MLFSITNLSDYKIEAQDGGLGHVYSFLFDDRNWTIRYLVVDTGIWLPGRKVLIAPPALSKPEVTMDAFPVKLTREEVKNSPDIDVEKPVSRQNEVELHQYYGWPPYWDANYEPIAAPYPPVVPPLNQEYSKEQFETPEETEEKNDPHLRSTKELIGYHIHANDGQIGHVQDFLIDDANWKIRYMIVDTRNWLPGKKVIIAPDWVQDISWAEEQVYIAVDKEKVENSPEFDSTAPIDRDYETHLYDYYGWPKYWL